MSDFLSLYTAAIRYTESMAFSRSRRRRQSRRAFISSTGDSDASGPVAATSAFCRRDMLLLLAIVLVALGVRAIYTAQMTKSPLFDQPDMDELYHVQWAQAIADGQTFVEGPYFRAPLYPAVLAVIRSVFGPGLLVPRIVQAVLGSLSCALLFLIGRQVFGRWIGAIAAFIAATYWMLVYFDGELLIPSLVVFLDLLLIYLLVRGVLAPSYWLYTATGIVLGLSALARPNILLLAPILAISLLIIHRNALRRAVGHVAALTLGCILVIAPVTVRNYVTGGDYVLISSQGGLNFFIGNNPESDGHTAIVPGTPGGWWQGYYASIRIAEDAAGRKLRPSEVSQYYFGRGMRFITGKPLEALELLWLKFRLFWTRWEISNNKGIEFWTQEFTPIVNYLPIGFGVIGPLGLLGLVLCLKRDPKQFYLVAFVLVYMLSVVLFFCTARYRMPVLPILILMGTYAVGHVLRAMRKQAWRTLATSAVILVPAVALVNWSPAGRQDRNDAFSLVRLGVAYNANGDVENAIRSFRRSLDIEPEFRTARFNLAKLLHQQGNVDDAVIEYRRALASPPKLSSETKDMEARIHINLAYALKAQGRLDEARRHDRLAAGLRSGR